VVERYTALSFDVCIWLTIRPISPDSDISLLDVTVLREFVQDVKALKVLRNWLSPPLRSGLWEFHKNVHHNIDMRIKTIENDDGLLSGPGLLRKIDQLRDKNIGQYVALPRVVSSPLHSSAKELLTFRDIQNRLLLTSATTAKERCIPSTLRFQ